MTEGAKGSSSSESEMWGNVLCFVCIGMPKGKQKKRNPLFDQRNNLVKQKFIATKDRKAKRVK